jgi:hypothetical protein
MTTDLLLQKRVVNCQAVLDRYSDDCAFTGLVDLMADAMHWCDAHGQDFHYALCLAGKHFIAELNAEPTEERRLP